MLMGQNGGYVFEHPDLRKSSLVDPMKALAMARVEDASDSSG